MTDARLTRVENDPIHEAAAEWVVRLQDPEVSLEDSVAWQAWMKADGRHAEAFNRVSEVSGLVREVSAPRARSAQELGRDAYDGSVALGDWVARRHPGRMRLEQKGRRFVLALAAAVAMVAVGLIALRGTGAPGVTPHVINTSVGENRSVTLDDGSKVVLGGNTRLEVALTREARLIELANGEAFFTVARDATRPFKVRAGDATVVAVGTEFNVRKSSDRALVSVVEGRVRVEPAPHVLPNFVLRELRPNARPVQLDAGQQTLAGTGGIELASDIEDPDAVTSWQTGRLAFRLQPLRYVLEDVNRYAMRPIVAADENVGAIVITGTVTSDNVEGWVRSLERGFGLRAIEESGRIVLRRR